MSNLNVGACWARPFGTYSQNKARTATSGSTGGAGPSTAPSPCKAKASPRGRRLLDGSGGPGMMLGNQENERVDKKEDLGSENTPPDPKFGSSSMMQNQVPPPPTSMPSTSVPPPHPSAGRQMDEVRVLLDTWYVIKPGNTQEKIAFFVAHTFDSKGAPRPNAMKVKGPSLATDCTRAKRRKRCSSYEPPTRPQPSSDVKLNDPALASGASGLGKPSLLSVAELVALVEQRTAMCLQDMVAVQGSLQHQQPHTTHLPQQPTLLREMAADPTPIVFLSESTDAMPSNEPLGPSSPIQTDQELEEEEQQWQETQRVAQAIAHFEAQKTLQTSATERLDTGSHEREWRSGGAASESGAGVSSPPPSPASHSPGEVTIAFRVSSLEPRPQLESAGTPRRMFMNCGGGVGQVGTRAKEKIAGDLYQLVNPSLLDSSFLPLCSSSPKCDADHHLDRQSCSIPEMSQELSTIDNKATGMERMTGFHVDVVVTGALDPPPGQLFFLQSPSKEEGKSPSAGSGPGMCPLDRGNNGSSSPGPGGSVAMGAVEEWLTQHDPALASVGVVEDCTKPSLCRLYQHVPHSFLEIRFQIQRLLGPRQYMLFLPDHIRVNILSYLPTRSLAALKCTCRSLKVLIETYAVRAVDSRWNQDPLYRDDPCKQCKRHYEHGDVSLCRWHPKPYHHDLPYGRSYWMCCLCTEKDTPGCRVGLHDNNWVQTPADSSQSARVQREDWSYEESR